MGNKEETATDKKAEANPTERVITKDLLIKYYGIEDITGVFADQAMVFHAGETFTLFFFQTSFPPTQDLAVLESLEEIPARCVARITLTPTLMQQFSAAIIKNLGQYQRMVEHIKESPSEG